MTGWIAVVPVKSWHAAKSRVEMPGDVRTELARALTLDTLDLLVAHADIDRVVVVTADADVSSEAEARGATALVEHRREALSPLNVAVVQACQWVAESAGDGRTVVIPADLAHLSPVSLASALGGLAAMGQGHIPDSAGTGTTLLAASAASLIEPRYGIGSSAAHAASGFLRLDDVDPRVRTDIDRLDDLVPEWAVGPGVAAIIRRIALGA